jgi:hypothetical protein
MAEEILSPWKSCKEHEPPYETLLLIHTLFGYKVLTRCWGKDGDQWWDDNQEVYVGHVSHWMEVPPMTPKV